MICARRTIRRSQRLACEPLEDRRLLSLQPVLVADLNTVPIVEERGFTPGLDTRLAAGNQQAFFQNWDAATGNELWRTDGTADGTFLVTDVFPGGGGSKPSEVTTVGDRVYFIAESRDGLHALWTSDGAADSANPLTTPVLSRRTDIHDLTAVGEALYFVARAPEAGFEIWKSDGTVEGTSLAVDVLPGPESSDPRFLTAVADEVYFTLRANHAWQLRRSNGTGDGTMILADIGVTRHSEEGLSALSPGEFTAVGDKLYFTTYDVEAGRELWVSDGTAEGTGRVADIAPGLASSDPQSLTAVGDLLYFTADDGASGRELWVSDGTEAGTVRVVDLKIGPEGSDPDQLTALDGQVYFAADDGVAGRELWRSNGTAEGTVLVADLTPGADGSEPEPLAPWGGTLLFSAIVDGASRALYATAGDGADLVNDLTEAGANAQVRSPAQLDSQVLFTTVDDEVGWKLWTTDGTDAGTTVVDDIRPGSLGSLPQGIIATDDALYFVLGAFTNDTRIWKAQGDVLAPVTPSGLHVFYDEYYEPTSNMMTVGDVLYFIADDGVLGPQVWKTDGEQLARLTTFEWQEVDARPNLFAGVGETMYFSIGDGPDVGIWKTDGTVEGTTLVSDQVVGEGAGSEYAIAIEGVLYFSGDAPLGDEYGATGSALWRTDGTEAGTYLVKDIHPFSNAAPRNFAEHDGIVYFSAFAPFFGGELWRTDGTEEGTYRLTDINPGTGNSIVDVFAPSNGTILISAENGQGDARLWKSDGTPDRFELLADISTGAGWSPDLPSWMVELDGIAYFTASTPELGTELWRTDGTTEGTYLVHDTFPGPDSGSSHQQGALGAEGFVVLGGAIFFVADDGEHGFELWTTDGTTDGTRIVADLVPGSGDSYPRDLRGVNGALYFTADDGIHGGELWKLEAPPGDTNFDGAVDLLDFERLKASFGEEGPNLAGDLNYDDVVDLLDFNILKDHFGADVAAAHAASFEIDSSVVAAAAMDAVLAAEDEA